MLSTNTQRAIAPKLVDKEIGEEVDLALPSPAQYLEQDVEAVAPPSIDDSVLAGFRAIYRSHAASIAEKTLAAGTSATEKILQMAGWIQEMKLRLSRKEFGVFVKELLQWVGDEVRKYLDIAKAFEGFDLSQLVNLEPFTILKLRTKRYAPVVEKLREQPVITPKVVQELVKDLLPKQPRKKLDGLISGWKQCRSGGGRYYNVLLHDEETGILIEQQAQAEHILPQRVIADAIALRSQHKSSTVHPDLDAPKGKEEGIDVEQEASHELENKKLNQELEKRDLLIAELEAQLARRKASPVAETESVVEIASRELNEIEERQVAETANGQITQDEVGTVAATWAKEPEQELTYLEPLVLDDAQNLELEQNNGKLSDSVQRVTEDKGALGPRPNFLRHSRKLTPVEILTSSGSWVGGYFVHSCIAVANLIGQERRFTLFDANEDMCSFLGQIRPARSGGKGDKFS